MEQIKRYNLPENTNRLYKEEAISSIGLTRDIADKINELVDAYNALAKEDLNWKHEQEGKIRKGVIFMKDNLLNSLHDLLKIYDNDTIKKAILEVYGYELGLLKVFTTPQMFGAKGNGIADDTEAIQKAIDEANTKNRAVFLPKGIYKISKPLTLNGCSLIGEPGNVFHGVGSVIECVSKDFTAIQQGSTKTEDIMFNITDIIVKNANTAFEIIYAINSKFERLYAMNCNTGFKIGNTQSVGSMFCEFNNLYTSECVTGIEVNSAQYFNNNRFNNGFIQGNEKAMTLTVTGGSGAIDNVFNNVEFRSSTGRGIELSNAINTIFNSCYFECGANVLRALTYSTATLSNCIYGSFIADNAFQDENMIYSVGGSALTFEGGTIFLDSDYVNKVFFGTGNTAVHQNIVVLKTIVKNGTASGFTFFSEKVKTVAFAPEEQVTTTETVTIEAGASLEVPFTYTTAFSSIPNVVLYTMRGASGAGLSTIVSERLKDGGKLNVKNSGSTSVSVSFSIYAKIL